MSILSQRFLVVVYLVQSYDELVAADKRLLLNDPDVVEARFHQMDITVQNLRSQISSYDNVIGSLHNVITGMQSNINGLKQEIQVKDDQIVNLTTAVTFLQYKDQTKESEIGSLTATVNSLQQKDQTKDSQIGTLSSTVYSLQQKVNEKKPGCQTGRMYHRIYPQVIGWAKTPITFNPPFEETPQMVWGTSGIDYNHDFNMRFRTGVHYLTRYSCELYAETWSDTEVYEIEFQWMDCP